MIIANVPLHPMVVHFPIVLGLLLPLLIGVWIWAERRQKVTSKSWLVLVVVSALLAGSAFTAARFGEEDEEGVERVVRESAIEQHEEAGEVLVKGAFAVLVLSALPLLGRKRRFFQGLALAGALILIIPILQAGKSGGELVYEHGAADAYLKNPKQAISGKNPEQNGSRRSRSHDEHERNEHHED